MNVSETSLSGNPKMDHSFAMCYREHFKDSFRKLDEGTRPFTPIEMQLDLAMRLARGVPTKILRRGEFEATASQLAKRWHCSESTARRFLQEQLDKQKLVLVRAATATRAGLYRVLAPDTATTENHRKAGHDAHPTSFEATSVVDHSAGPEPAVTDALKKKRKYQRKKKYREPNTG